MLPFGLPPVAPALTLAELLGPLAPLSLIPVVVGLAVILGMLALRPLAGRGLRAPQPTTRLRPGTPAPLRPAA
ncbi:MAG: hypothetical protein KIT14_10710 [bacterium]|nr:hypothetical protein [bacterium]